MTLMDELVDTYLEGNMEFNNYLDLETGTIVADLDEEVTGEPGIDWDDPRSLERYIDIPQLTSDEAYWVRVRFAGRTEGDSQGLLSDALNGHKPFRRFKDALSRLRLWDEWNKFERDWALRELQFWVEQLPMPYETLAKRYEAYWQRSK